jgi:DHA1 family bicyclomycin/chloramphenicol resistance-like MFS transporter
LLGPSVGGQILGLAGWRAIFGTLVVVGVLTLVALSRLPETLPAHRRNREPLGQAFRQYGQLIRGRRLMGYAGAGGFFFAGTFAYIAGSPFAYIDYHHVAARSYGLLFGLGIVGIMLTSSLNSRLVTRFGTRRMLVVGTSAAGLAGILLCVDARTDWLGLWGLVVPMFLFVSATGFIVANVVAGAMADFPSRAGAVSALVGAIQYGGGILGSALVGVFADGTPWPMGWVVGVSGVGCLVCAMLVPERSR